jgi:E3 ubiquitin-protein ligase RNF213
MVKNNLSQHDDGIDTSIIMEKDEIKEMMLRMFLCINLNIPILIVGGPGTSKSFSVGLLLKALKGYNSKSVELQSYPQAIRRSFQCTKNTSTYNLKKFIDKNIEFQKQLNSSQSKYKQPRVVCMVLEEVGHLELSQDNPQKILHHYLDEPEASYIALSNWSLDPAKNSRFQLF